MDVIRKPRHMERRLVKAGLERVDDPRMPHLGQARPQYTEEEKLEWIRRAWTELGEPFTCVAYQELAEQKAG